ncbi:hypothetical protein F4677DRAFT_460806 [Hypoxylon crocopeplum]|nr:hypothetical protein F4677DRAFT_460806 [Hypoxylon crocopeplum]
MIDTMIDDPFGPEWKRYSEKLRLRLWRSADKFEMYVAEMSAATKELKDKLCIQADGYTRLTDRPSIIQELKKDTSFTLRKKDYDNVLSRIKTGNQVLQSLATQNHGLEPDRRHRSQARVTKLLRGLSSSIYNAICSALTCTCFNKHSVGLELMPRSAVIVPGDAEEQVATKFNFHVVMNSVGAEDGKWMTYVAEDQQHTTHWKGLALRLASSSKGSPSSPSILTPSPSAPNVKAITKRGIKWAPSISFKNPRADTAPSSAKSFQTLTVLPMTTNSPPAQIVNLCHVVHKAKHKQVAGCFGYILDVERKFEMYHPSDPPNFERRVTLRQVINGSEPGLPPFNYLEQIQLALTISMSILHLYETPCVTEEMDTNSINSKRQTGIGLRGRILETGGCNYAAAVGWCLESVYRVANLQNDNFCQNFYEEVVARLEEDANLSNTD